jgi:hypothetical protein
MGNEIRLTVEHDGVEYGGQIATIKSTALGFEDHGILTAWLHCEWQGGGIGVGGFCLDQTTGKPDYARQGTAYGLDHIIRLIETVGVSKWEDLRGKHVIVLFNGTSAWGAQSVGIANVTDPKKVLILREHADSWLESEPPSSPLVSTP